MCHFHYRKFDSCGDYGIEVSVVCDEALWRAGLRGVLQICVPRILERSLEWSGTDDHEPPKPALFRGYDGFCDMCATKFKLPCSILQRSYTDHELDYSQAWNSFNADDLAPYISFSGLTASVPELLCITDQFEAAHMRQGPSMIFHKSLEQGTWSQLRKALPFTYQGEFESDYTLDLDDTMKRLDINAGITEYDRDQVVRALQHGPHPRVVYNNLFRPRGMPLGHFSISIVNGCQQMVSKFQAQKVAAARKSLQQYADYSDDSSLTTLSNTPVLSDGELTTMKSPSQGSELSATLKYDGSTSTPRKSRKRQAFSTTRTKTQATAFKFALSAASPSRHTKAASDFSANGGASTIHGLATDDSSYKLRHDEIELTQTQGCSSQDDRRGSRVSASVAESEQRSTAGKVGRPRRMAITEQEFDQRRFEPLNEGSESSNITKSVLNSLDQDSEQHQHLKDPTQESGNRMPVPYYKAERAFKWKILERPGYKRTPKVSRATGSQERKARGRQDYQRPPVTAALEAPTATQSPAPQRLDRVQCQSFQTQEPVLILDDSEGDVKMEEAGQSPSEPETHLDSSTVRRLQASGLLGRSRRR